MSLPNLAALSLLEQCMMVILPPFCSDLNPIERFWLHRKNVACANKLGDNMDITFLGCVIDRCGLEGISG
jgi:hypothetical protein